MQTSQHRPRRLFLLYSLRHLSGVFSCPSHVYRASKRLDDHNLQMTLWLCTPPIFIKRPKRGAHLITGNRHKRPLLGFNRPTEISRTKEKDWGNQNLSHFCLGSKLTHKEDKEPKFRPGFGGNEKKGGSEREREQVCVHFQEPALEIRILNWLRMSVPPCRFLKGSQKVSLPYIPSSICVQMIWCQNRNKIVGSYSLLFSIVLSAWSSYMCILFVVFWRKLCTRDNSLRKSKRHGQW